MWWNSVVVIFAHRFDIRVPLPRAGFAISSCPTCWRTSINASPSKNNNVLLLTPQDQAKPNQTTHHSIGKRTGQVEVVESETPTYSSEDLSNMSLRQLRSLMLQAGIGVEGCLEKNDLLERVMSSRLVTITHGNPDPSRSPPPPPPPEASTAHPGGGGGGGGGGGSTLRDDAPAGARAPAAAVGGGGRGGGEREEDSSASAAARRTGRTAGWWWGNGRRDGSGSGSGSTSQAEADRPPPPPQPQAPSAGSVPAVRPLESMSVKELREIASRLGVSTAGCLEKRDMVERIRGCGRYRETAAGVGRASR